MMENLALLTNDANELKGAGRYKEAELKYDEVIPIVKSELELASECDIDTITLTLAEAYNERGHIRYLQVAFTEAVVDFTEALHVNPHMAVAYYNRGLIHYRLARYDAAVIDMDQCLALNPEFDSAKDCRQQAIVDKQDHMAKFPAACQ